MSSLSRTCFNQVRPGKRAVRQINFFFSGISARLIIASYHVFRYISRCGFLSSQRGKSLKALRSNGFFAFRRSIQNESTRFGCFKSGWNISTANSMNPDQKDLSSQSRARIRVPVSAGMYSFQFQMLRAISSASSTGIFFSATELQNAG